MDSNWSHPLPFDNSFVCILCESDIEFSSGDAQMFVNHMKEEHESNFEHQLLLAVHFVHKDHLAQMISKFENSKNSSEVIECMLCRKEVSYVDQDRKEFELHIQIEHTSYWNQDFILALHFIEEQVRNQIISQFKQILDELYGITELNDFVDTNVDVETPNDVIDFQDTAEFDNRFQNSDVTNQDSDHCYDNDINEMLMDETDSFADNLEDSAQCVPTLDIQQYPPSPHQDRLQQDSPDPEEYTPHEYHPNNQYLDDDNTDKMNSIDNSNNRNYTSDITISDFAHSISTENAINESLMDESGSYLGNSEETSETMKRLLDLKRRIKNLNDGVDVGNDDELFTEKDSTTDLLSDSLFNEFDTATKEDDHLDEIVATENETKNNTSRQQCEENKMFEHMENNKETVENLASLKRRRDSYDPIIESSFSKSSTIPKLQYSPEIINNNHSDSIHKQNKKLTGKEKDEINADAKRLKLDTAESENKDHKNSVESIENVDKIRTDTNVNIILHPLDKQIATNKDKTIFTSNETKTTLESENITPPAAEQVNNILQNFNAKQHAIKKDRKLSGNQRLGLSMLLKTKFKKKGLHLTDITKDKKRHIVNTQLNKPAENETKENPKDLLALNKLQEQLKFTQISGANALPAGHNADNQIPAQNKTILADHSLKTAEDQNKTKLNHQNNSEMKMKSDSIKDCKRKVTPLLEEPRQKDESDISQNIPDKEDSMSIEKKPIETKLIPSGSDTKNKVEHNMMMNKKVENCEYFRKRPNQLSGYNIAQSIKNQFVTDESLPTGWRIRKTWRENKKGYDVEFLSPDGRKARSKVAAVEYMKLMGIYTEQDLAKIMPKVA